MIRLDISIDMLSWKETGLDKKGIKSQKNIRSKEFDRNSKPQRLHNI